MRKSISAKQEDDALKKCRCVECPDNSIAVSTVNELHGRWFAGKVITAAYIPAEGYFANLVGAAAFRYISDASVYTSN